MSLPLCEFLCETMDRFAFSVIPHICLHPHSHDVLTELNQPFVDDYLPALLAQASKLISAEFHAVVEAEGISVTEWRVLASLTGMQGVSTGQLAQISVSKQPTVTRLLDRMEAKGFVERFSHESDRRLTMVRIAPAGQTLVADLIRHAKEHEKRVLQPFGVKRAEALKAMLRHMIELHRPPG